MHTTEYALIKCLSTTYSDTHVDFFNDCRSLRVVALLVKAPHRLEVKIALQPFFVLWGRKQAMLTEQGICVTSPFLLAGPTAGLKPQDKNFKQLDFITAA